LSVTKWLSGSFRGVEMSQTFLEVASCAPSRKADSYICAIAPTISNGLAAITSADELLLVDLQNLQIAKPLYFADVPLGLTSMVIGDKEGTSIICAGRDGATVTFDVRSQKRTSHFTQGRPLTCPPRTLLLPSTLLSRKQTARLQPWHTQGTISLPAASFRITKLLSACGRYI
jgi:hypothetical protein